MTDGFGKGHHLHLIDGSAFIFRAYHALPPLTRRSDGLPIGAVAGFCNMVWKYLQDGKGSDQPTHAAVIFDHSARTFRNDIYPEYKAQRQATPEDLLVQIEPSDLRLIPGPQILFADASRDGLLDIGCVQQPLAHQIQTTLEFRLLGYTLGFGSLRHEPDFENGGQRGDPTLIGRQLRKLLVEFGFCQREIRSGDRLAIERGDDFRVVGQCRPGQECGKSGGGQSANRQELAQHMKHSRNSGKWSWGLSKAAQYGGNA